MSEKELAIKLILDDKQAISGLNSAMRKFEGETRSATDSANLAWTGLASKFFLAQQALGPVIDLMGRAVRAAAEDEDAVARLNIALENQGITSREVSERYQEMANSLQRSTRFSDDAILEVQQTLVTFGNVGPAAMERVTKATLDLAAAKKIDLRAATDLLAKAAMGETGSLSRYGIIIDQTIPKGERFAEVLRLIEQRAGGFSEKTDTFADKQAKLGNAIGAVVEELGKFITQSPAVKGALDGMTEGAFKAAEALKKIREEEEARNKAHLEAIRNTPDVARFLQGREEAGMPSAEANFRRQMEQLFQDTGNAAGKAAEAERVAREQKMQAEIQAAQDQANLLFNTEQIKLQTIVSSTEIYKQLKDQETLHFIAAEQAKIDALMQTANLDANTQQKLLQQKQALAEAEKKIQAQKVKTQLAAEQARYKGTTDLALATADLTDAIAVATGKGSIKAVGIVLKAVVTAIQIAQEMMNSTLGPLGFLIGAIKLATIAVQSANAFAQLSAAEKALDAQRGQSVQAVTNVPGLAEGGTVSRSGAVLVGERGPELLSLPSGARVTPLDASAGQRVYHISVTINNPLFAPGNVTDQLVAELGPKISQFLDDERARA